MHLTVTEAETRLSGRYGIAVGLSEGDVEAASHALDELAPFVTPLEEYGELPNALKDYVALYAYILATDELPAITSEGIGDTRADYATPRRSQAARRMATLTAPYLKRRGARS